MAVTTCPDCGREVSTLAEACPQCGRPIAAQGSSPPKQAQRKISGDAVASLVFSLFPLVGLNAIVAVALGHRALRQIRRSGGTLRGRGVAIAGLILGYIQIAVVVVFIAAMLFGRDIGDEFQGLESTTSIAATSTTTAAPPTTTTALSFWAEPSGPAARAWAEGAIEYVESLNRGTWEDREAAISSNMAWARRVCGQLTDSDIPYPSPDDGLSETDQDALESLGDLSFLERFERTPAQVEADMRERLGVEQWELYGAVWYESLVFGLCVR